MKIEPCEIFHNHLRAKGITSVIGISTGSRDDRATWRIDFAADATDAQKKAANELLLSFDGDKVIRAKERIMQLEDAHGFTRKQREFFITTSEGTLKTAFQTVEAEIAAERVKLK